MRLPKLTVGEAVRVEWIDSYGSSGGWDQLDESDTEVVGCVTVGMVHASARDRITLVLSLDTVNGNVNGAITIPAVAITSLRRLEGQHA